MDPIVVVGGGIAGTTCALTLAESYQGEIVIITLSKLVKVTKNLRMIGRNMEEFIVEEIDTTDHQNELFGKNVKIILGLVQDLIIKEKLLIFSDFSESKIPSQLKYSKLCICTGAKPREFPLNLPSNGLADRILFIRDTQTVEKLKYKLEISRRIVIVGNGGIAIELAYIIKKCQVVWVIREDSIGSTFFDSGAAKFFLDGLELIRNGKNDLQGNDEAPMSKSFQFSTNTNEKFSNTSIKTFNSALGPDWIQDFELVGNSSHVGMIQDNLRIEKSTCLLEVNAMEAGGEWPIEVKLTNGASVKCDIIVCAIGVEPSTDWVKSNSGYSFERSSIDGGLLIDTQMGTSVADIYAAGDVVSCERWPTNPLWSQMRLWTQARQMGQYSAQCIMEHMQGRDPSIYFNFECFSHITRFFGYKVVLLGCFNGQNLENHEIIVRINPPRDYVKLVLQAGRIKGAVLVGDTGLEETFENLINDQIDVSRYGEQIVDGTVDIEDYFD